MRRGPLSLFLCFPSISCAMSSCTCASAVKADVFASSSMANSAILSFMELMSTNNFLISMSLLSRFSCTGTFTPSILFSMFLMSAIDSDIAVWPICICVLSFVNCVVFVKGIDFDPETLPDLACVVCGLCWCVSSNQPPDQA